MQAKFRDFRARETARLTIRHAFALLILCVFVSAPTAQAADDPAAGDWAFYGHDAGGQRFSPLDQVDRTNVAGLKPAWTFHTGDIADGHDGPRSGLETGGRRVDVVIAANKTGFLYVLDRDTGRPVFPVEERPVPASDVPGETASPTQPFSVGLPALAPRSLEPDQVFGPTPADREACRAVVAGASGHELFFPPSLKGVIAAPGNIGGPNWSGFSFDPTRNLLIVNINNMPALVRLVPPDQLGAAGKANHHGDVGPQRGAPYGMARGLLFAGPSDAPCARPPWGELLAVDLAKGVIRWRRPLGTMAELSSRLGDETLGLGSPSLGGSIVTAGGLTFIGGTVDRKFRAFDTDTGRQLWSAELPASAHATPMTFEAKGRQYVVIAAGGSAKITEERQGDAIVAFALPRTP